MNYTRNLYGKEAKDLYGHITDQEVLNYINTFGVRPLFLCITGSHMWNLARADSDLDIRGIYVKPTELAISLHPGDDTITEYSILGKDIDLTLFEVEKAFNMLLHSNGNIVEMLLAPTIFFQDESIDWQGIAKKFLTRKLGNYYKGYYHSQRKRAMRNRGGKALVYTFREIYQGIWLMKHGEIIHDFKILKAKVEDEFGKSPLLGEYENRDTWYKPLTPEQIRAFESEWESWLQIFERARSESSLPNDYDGYHNLNEELLDLRRQEW